MKLSELMQGKTPNPDFAGIVVNDNMVLAINVTPSSAIVADADYEVIQLGIQGMDPQLNAQTQDDTFLRAGTSTTKTGNQRSFAVSGARYVGDAAQDFMFSHSVAFGIGESVITDYIYFNILTGKGERGKAAVIVNSDGGGNAGENAAISVDIKQALTLPAEYVYTTTSNASNTPSSEDKPVAEL